jgi:hypothetical protein
LAEYTHVPPASQQAARVSEGDAPQDIAWHLPPRHIAPLSQGQPQNVPGARLANACEKAAEYCAAALLLTAAVVQPSQAAAGHEVTSPTATQSLSSVQDWSYADGRTMVHGGESAVLAST